MIFMMFWKPAYNPLNMARILKPLLASYPQFADELRPLLKAALSARAMPLPSPSASGMRRGRARFLQKAAEIREAKVAPRIAAFCHSIVSTVGHLLWD